MTFRILDGTHRWVKAWQDGTATLPVIALDLDVDAALQLMRRFQHVKFTANQVAQDDPRTLTWEERCGLVGNAIMRGSFGQPLTFVDLPDVRQDNHWRCGPSVVTSVLRLFGEDADEDAVSEELGTNEEMSTDPQAIVDLFERRGWTVEKRNGMTLDDLSHYQELGWPVIVCVQDYMGRRSPKAAFNYGHYLGVTGRIDSQHVFAQDPSLENWASVSSKDVEGGDVPQSKQQPANIDEPGKIMVREDDWLRVWHDQGADGTKYVRWGCAVGGPRLTEVTNANPNHDEVGRFTSGGDFNSFKEVMQRVLGKRVVDSEIPIRVSLKDVGNHFLHVRRKGDTVKIDFAQTGKDYDSHSATLQPGSLDTLRKVRELAGEMHKAGFKLEVDPGDEQRARLYDSMLTKMGMKKIEGSLLYNLSFPQEPLRNAVPNALDVFQQWLKRQMGQLIIGKTQEQMWDEYIRQGFRKGAGRAFDDVRKPLTGMTKPDFYQGSREEFLKSAFGQPVAKEKVKLLASRSFDELENVTADMSNKMSRVLTDGLVQGKHPNDVARDMTDEVDISFGRAKVIARTTLIGVHAEGQLIAFEQLGVEELGVEVEFSDAADGLVCPECADLDGQTFSIDEAHGVIPVHPQCRCCFRPAGAALTGNLLVDDLRQPVVNHWDDLTQLDALWSTAADKTLNAYEGEGHWVTLEAGQHVFIGGDGQMQFHGPKESSDVKGRNGDKRAGQRDGSNHAADGSGLATKTGRSSDSTGGGSGSHDDKSAGGRLVQDVPASKEAVNAKLDRYEKFFRDKGMHDQADWMAKLKSHVNDVGTDQALKELGDEIKGKGEQVHYAGQDLEGKGDRAFVEGYLNKHGISTVHETQFNPDKKVISTTAPSSDAEGVHSRGKESDVFPKLQGLKDKLDEAQHLPGLEKSEDLAKLMGGERGAGVSHLDKKVIDKLDEHYGKGQWIVKSYGDEAYAGFGIYFPQRAEAIKRDAQNTIWAAGEQVGKHGFHLARDGNTGKVVGLVHASGDAYKFGSPEYNKTIHGDVRHWADKAQQAAEHEHGPALPKDEHGNLIKRFMAQPAFPVVGVSDADRAAGRTHEGTGEGRVHIVTKDGVASVVPHSTWIKGEPLPVVFENEHTRSMAKAAVDAINALPASEKQGQLYAPDVVRTAQGHKVVEANPANEAGASGYLQDNPFIIDSYVSHVTGREPAHVKFIRSLLTKKDKTPAENQLLADLIALDLLWNESGDNCGIGPGGFQPGNTCAKGEGGKSEQEDERDERIGTAVSKKVHAKLLKQAMMKFANVTQPTEEEKAEATAGLAKKGANKYRRDLVGNSKDRAKRREKLLKEFGDGKVCPCIYCGITIGDHTDTLEQDKMVITADGGRYRMDNLVPACKSCNGRRGDMPFDEAMEKVTKHVGTAK